MVFFKVAAHLFALLLLFFGDCYSLSSVNELLLTLSSDIARPELQRRRLFLVNAREANPTWARCSRLFLGAIHFTRIASLTLLP
jgi:hypothetical protein